MIQFMRSLFLDKIVVPSLWLTICLYDDKSKHDSRKIPCQLPSIKGLVEISKNKQTKIRNFKMCDVIHRKIDMSLSPIIA